MRTVAADNAFGRGRRLSTLGRQSVGKDSSDRRGRPGKRRTLSGKQQPSTSRDGATPGGAELRANLIGDMSSAMEVSAESVENARKKDNVKKKFAKRLGKRATRMRLASENMQYEDVSNFVTILYGINYQIFE